MDISLVGYKGEKTMKYVSKAYLKEKFRNITWDMEYLFSQSETDSIPEEAVRNVYALKDNMFSILKELDMI